MKKKASGPRMKGFTFDARSGRAHFRVYLPGAGGKKKSLTTHAENRADALEKWAAFRRRALSVDPSVSRKRYTLRTYLAEYGANLTARMRPRTKRTVSDIIECHLLPQLGDVLLKSIKRPVVADMVGRLRTEKELAASSVNRITSVLRRILKDAVAREALDSYPILGSLPRESEAAVRLELSEEERLRFLGTFRDFAAFKAAEKWPLSLDDVEIEKHWQRYQAVGPVFVLALETGLRRGDLLRLRWSDVDLADGSIAVVTGKTGEVVRLTLSDAALEALADLYQRSPDHEEAPLVCVARSGQPYDEISIRRYFAHAKGLAKIKRRLRFHDLRHTFASRLASRGVSIQLIAQALGHSSVRMSERYARPSREASNAIRDALNAAPKTSPKTSPKEPDAR